VHYTCVSMVQPQTSSYNIFIPSFFYFFLFCFVFVQCLVVLLLGFFSGSTSNPIGFCFGSTSDVSNLWL